MGGENGNLIMVNQQSNYNYQALEQYIFYTFIIIPEYKGSLIGYLNKDNHMIGKSINNTNSCRNLFFAFSRKKYFLV